MFSTESDCGFSDFGFRILDFEFSDCRIFGFWITDFGFSDIGFSDCRILSRGFSDLEFSGLKFLKNFSDAYFLPILGGNGVESALRETFTVFNNLTQASCIRTEEQIPLERFQTSNTYQRTYTTRIRGQTRTFAIAKCGNENSTVDLMSSWLCNMSSNSAGQSELFF